MLAHSPLGASGMERWANCGGSASLIEVLKTGQPEHFEPDPEWRRDGIQAHDLAADLLSSGKDAWEATDRVRWSALTAEMMDAVQVHLDYVRSRKGWQFVELRMHRPEFHELAYGTTDVAVLDPEALEIIDYKHGVGIVVEVEGNLQVLYYAFMVIDELGAEWPDDTPIKLTIVQPRVPWRDPIRSWDTTVGFIRNWAITVLKPTMENAYTAGYLVTGEHCRFCPAQLICPGFLSVAARAQKLDLSKLKDLSAPLLAELLGETKVMQMAVNAIKQEARARMIGQRQVLPGWKVVRGIADRIWKEDAPVAAQWGYQPMKAKSPAMVEKESSAGKKFVAEWAFTPDAGFDLAPEDDRRKAVPVDTAEKWQKILDNLKEKQ